MTIMKHKTGFKLNAYIKCLISISLFILMVGCGSGGVSSSNQGKTGVLQIPTDLISEDLPDGTLKTYLTIDNEARQEVTLSSGSSQLSLTVFSQGEHDFLIELEFSSDTQATILIAQATIKVNIVEGNNAITFVKADFTYPDSNNDETSNWDALIANLNPQACVLGASKLGQCSL